VHDGIIGLSTGLGWGRRCAKAHICMPAHRSRVLSEGRIGGHVGSGGVKGGQYGRSITERAEPPVVGGNMVMGAEARTEEVTRFIEASTEPVSRSWALKSTHGLVATFDATLILLQSIVEAALGRCFTPPSSGWPG
jgi:hypothetical protein